MQVQAEPSDMGKYGLRGYAQLMGDAVAQGLRSQARSNGSGPFGKACTSRMNGTGNRWNALTLSLPPSAS